MKFYGSDIAEQNDFQTGQLDVMDNGQSGTGIPASQYAYYDSNPDWLITPAQPSSSYFGIFFNYASSTWTHWGCDWGNGNSPCGVEIREAFAHLIDRARFVTDGPLLGAGVQVNDPNPPTQRDPCTGQPVATPITPPSGMGTIQSCYGLGFNQCSWDTLESSTLPIAIYGPSVRNPINSGYDSKYGNCLSAFHLADNPGGFADYGSPDFCAAVDHLIMATLNAPSLGLQRDPAAPLDAFGNHCGIDPASPGLANIATHLMRGMVRNSLPRSTLGLGFSSALDRLFANGVVSRLIVGSGEQTGTRFVFSCCIGFATDDWDWYTFAYQDDNPYPTNLFYLLHSRFASNLCGPGTVTGTTQGALQAFPSNPTFVCIPALDSALDAMVSTGDINTAYSDTYQALNVAGEHAQSIPVASVSVRSAALREGAGWVNEVGLAYQNRFSFYGIHQGGYRQVDPLNRYHLGNAGQQIRYGQASRDLLRSLNPYNAQWTWEFNVLQEVYDPLFSINPVVPTQVFCWVCDTFMQTVDRSGNTHFFIELRQSLRWQDDVGGSSANPVVGGAIDAYDVKFSILTERDLAAVTEIAGGLGQNVAQVLGVNVLGPTELEVVIQGQGIAESNNLAGVLLLPRHIWELPGDNTYGDVGTVDPAKLDPSYDIISARTFIGSGQFECVSIFPDDAGSLGTGCTLNPDSSRGGQAIPPGGSIFLVNYDRTAQPGAIDGYNQWFRDSNPLWGFGPGTVARSGQFQEFSWADRYDNATVTIQDLASVAACFGKSSASSCADYSYWLTPAFHPGPPNTVTTELTVVASHLGDTWVYPFSWNGDQSMQPGQQLVNIVPFNS